MEYLLTMKFSEYYLTAAAKLEARLVKKAEKLAEKPYQRASIQSLRNRCLDLAIEWEGRGN